jgi:hypothetical protein
VPAFEVSVALNVDVDELLVGIIAQLKDAFISITRPPADEGGGGGGPKAVNNDTHHHHVRIFRNKWVFIPGIPDFWFFLGLVMSDIFGKSGSGNYNFTGLWLVLADEIENCLIV